MDVMEKAIGIESCAKRFADAHAALTKHVRGMQDDQAAVTKRYETRIAGALDTYQTRKRELEEAIDQNRAMFAERRTTTISGVEIGLRKTPDTVMVTDEGKTIAAIKKNLPQLADILIKTTEKIVMATLKRLDGAQMKKIGVAPVAGDDKIVITPPDEDVEGIAKLIVACEG